jgi:hypothetical protein
VIRVSGWRRVPLPPARMTPFMARDATRGTVIVDAENVRRSRWPNVSREELVDRTRAWAADRGLSSLVVFDGRAPEDAEDLVSAGASADDWIAEHAHEHAPYWLVTSDRELRQRAGGGAERVLGGGGFLKELGYDIR